MTQVGRLHLDPTSYRLDRRFFRRIWQLSKPYWSRKDAWRSWIGLGTLLGSVVAYSLFGAWASFVLKRQTDALLGHHQPLFWGLLGLQAAILGGRVGISMTQGFVSGRMVLHWRRWLTVYLVDRYLARRTYYEIALDHRIDNPDQRIQEETGIFCTYMAGIPQQVFGTFVDIGVQSVVIATIAPSLMWGIFLFAALKTAVMVSVYIPSIRKNFELTVSEADLRYGLLHVRDNAETVAFYRGEYAEKRHLVGRLWTVIAKQKALIMYYVPVTGVILGFDVIWMVLPLLLLAPQFFAHHVAYGAIAQATFLWLESARRETTARRHETIDEPGIAAVLADPRADAESQLVTEERVECAVEVLSACSDSAKKVFRLAYGGDGLSHAEVAERVGLSLQRVRQILCEVRAKLRTALEGEDAT